MTDVAERLEEGQITVQFDELLDPRPNGKKPGSFYHFVSVRKAGQGTAELYITKEVYDLIRALRLDSGAPMLLTFGLNKWNGQFEPRLLAVSAA